MLSTKERKLERINSGLNDTLSTRTYNIILGACILYGFLMNAIMVATCGPLFADMNYGIFLIGYFVSCIIGTILTRTNNPVISFIGYNLVVVPIGAVLTVCLPNYYMSDILSAIMVTGIVVVIMMGLSTMHPNVFAKMGTTLLIALLVSIVAELVAMLLGYGGTIFNWLFIVIFSLYIGYDWNKAQMYPKTLDNAIDSALDIYLDIINLFIRLLSIIGKKDD